MDGCGWMGVDGHLGVQSGPSRAEGVVRRDGGRWRPIRPPRALLWSGGVWLGRGWARMGADGPGWAWMGRWGWRWMGLGSKRPPRALLGSRGGWYGLVKGAWG